MRQGMRSHPPGPKVPSEVPAVAGTAVGTGRDTCYELREKGRSAARGCDQWPYWRLAPRSTLDSVPLIDDGLEILSEHECRALLGRGGVGRVAITLGALPAVLPVNYALLEGAIVFLTGEGTKLRAALDRAVVAFEVDEIDAPRRQGWSVLAVGVAAEITDDEELTRARRLNLQPLAGGDRSHFVRIQPEFLSGRRIANGAANGTAVGNGVVTPRPPG